MQADAHCANRGERQAVAVELLFRGLLTRNAGDNVPVSTSLSVQDWGQLRQRLQTGTG